MRLPEAARRLEAFERGALTSRLATLEATFCGLRGARCSSRCDSDGIDSTLLQALLELKRVSGQINVSIHAVGVLLSLSAILKPHELVESLSLGAGNTGRSFDLVTNRRIAEFKFIRWRGGAESIRQNAIFKDFYGLAEARIRKEKYLYVLGLQHPLRFFSGGRSLTSVMSRNSKLLAAFRTKYGERFLTVREYFLHRKHAVQIVDLLPIVPILSKLPSGDGLAV